MNPPNPLPLFQPVPYSRPSLVDRSAPLASVTTGTTYAGTYTSPTQVSEYPFFHTFLEGPLELATTSAYPGTHPSQLEATSHSGFLHSYSDVSTTTGAIGTYVSPDLAFSNSHSAHFALEGSLSIGTQPGHRLQVQGAANTIRVSGPENDGIISHRRVDPSRSPQDWLCVSGNIPYTVPLCQAPRGTHKTTVDATSLKWYPLNIQKVLSFARHALANDMVNNLGWPHGQTARTAYMTAMIEGIEQANVILNKNVQLTRDMETLLLRVPATFVLRAVISP
ncbi:hypothetical protein J3R83DRAFT_3972 [Lanmaoa asiatica]|nr:hypothetical protein J3R83DRAFT_3972 [Lanmaoa asiatica]